MYKIIEMLLCERNEIYQVLLSRGYVTGFADYFAQTAIATSIYDHKMVIGSYVFKEGHTGLL